jgi:signal transduction histidine kinase
LASRLERSAVTGLLVVCILLAGGLVLNAVLGYRAARQAAGAVLHSRAVEVATAVASAVRLHRGTGEELRLDELAKELAGEEVGIAICDLEGRVLAAAGPGPEAGVGQGQELLAGRRLDVLGELRAHGQVHRTVKGPGGEYLEQWQPMAAPPRRRGWGRRWWQGMGKGPGPFGAGGPRRWLRLVRVTVSAGVADELMAPARTNVVMATVVSGLLLLIGVVMHLAARRARRAEQELQRRRALAALGEMAAVLAHEVRTPLASIKGNAQLVGETRPDDERIQAVVREAGRLERLVNGLLDYARPPEPRRVPCDPDELATRAAQIVAGVAEAARVDLMIDPADCGACLSADPDRILQVLVNLLQNAVEASSGPGTRSPGPVVLRVRRGSGRVTFTVLDTGPGLGGVKVEQLLRPFFSTKQRGAGLGLSVARQIVEQHGGELRLVDRKEGGAMAEAILPERSHDR